MKKVTLYTDGACRGNPGRGGYGCILMFTDAGGNTHSKEFSAGYLNTTNNRMELLAVITGLEKLKEPCEVSIYSDSKYVCDAFNQKWVDGWIAKGWRTASKKPVKNVDLWQRLLVAIKSHSVKFIWVKGHANNKYNERCDLLATSAADADEANLLIDSEFRN